MPYLHCARRISDLCQTRTLTSGQADDFLEMFLESLLYGCKTPRDVASLLCDDTGSSSSTSASSASSCSANNAMVDQRLLELHFSLQDATMSNDDERSSSSSSDQDHKDPKQETKQKAGAALSSRNKNNNTVSTSAPSPKANPKITLRTFNYSIMSYSDARKRGAVSDLVHKHRRNDWVFLSGTDEVAYQNAGSCASHKTQIKVLLSDGASLVLKQQSPTSMTILATSPKKKRSTIQVQNSSIVQSLFCDFLNPSSSQPSSELAVPDTLFFPHKAPVCIVSCKEPNSFSKFVLPVWISNMVGKVAQDVFRIQCFLQWGDDDAKNDENDATVATAATSGSTTSTTAPTPTTEPKKQNRNNTNNDNSSENLQIDAHKKKTRPKQHPPVTVVFDKCTLLRFPSSIHSRMPQTCIVAPVHASFAKCICKMHGKERPASSFRNLEFKLSMCGHPIAKKERCRFHCEVAAKQSSLFRGVCTRVLEASVRCVHDTKACNNRPGAYTKMTFRDPGDTKELLSDLLSCASTLCPNGSSSGSSSGSSGGSSNSPYQKCIDKCYNKLSNRFETYYEKLAEHKEKKRKLQIEDIEAATLLQSGCARLVGNRVCGPNNAIHQLSAHQHLFRQY